MAKKKTKTATPDRPFVNKLLASFKKYWFLWIVGIGLVGFFGIYRPLGIYLDKQRFVKAEAEIEKLAVQIQEKIGSADQVAKDNSCRYASRKFERGPLSCTLRIHLFFENKDFGQATELMNAASAISDGSLRDNFNQDIEVAAFKAVDEDSSQRFSQLIPLEPIGCSISYWFPSVNDYSIPLSSEYDENLRITLSCSDSARAEHFTLIN